MYSQSTINFCSVSSVLSFLSFLLFGFLFVLRVSYQSFSVVFCAAFSFFFCLLSFSSLSFFVFAFVVFFCFVVFFFFFSPPLFLFFFFSFVWPPGCTPSQLSFVVRCPPRGFSSFLLS